MVDSSVVKTGAHGKHFRFTSGVPFAKLADSSELAGGPPLA